MNGTDKEVISNYMDDIKATINELDAMPSFLDKQKIRESLYQVMKLVDEL